MNRQPLPVDEIIPDLLTALSSGSPVVLDAEPGAGKTTRVPPALVGNVTGTILVLEPRRVAARLAARRIAEELGEPCGETVGFHIRHEHCAKASTRVKFITEGLFLHYLGTDPGLSGIGCIILDEFHERNIHTDIALAYVRALRESTRPDLHLILMSATLDTEQIRSWDPSFRHVHSKGRVFPVSVRHRPFTPQPQPVEVLAGGAVAECWKSTQGHLLVFLSGQSAIRRTRAQLEDFARANDAALLELYADLPTQKQDEVFAPSERRKIILATNVAETSITIDGVTAVIDSGLAKISGHASWNGLPTLEEKPVSQASCQQRAGRAGRTAPGICLRLFTEQEFSARPRHLRPEILRSDLAQVVLDILNLADRHPGLPTLDTLPWLDTPEGTALASARELLRLLGATDSNGHLTDLGRRMAALPLHPRLARVVLSGREHGCLPQAILGAALVSEEMLVRDNANPTEISADSDIAHQAALFRAWHRRERLHPATVRSLSAPRAQRIERTVRDLASILGVRFSDCLEPSPSPRHHARAFLAGFPDRVCQVRRAKTGAARTTRNRTMQELTLCQGGGALLSQSSVVQDNEFLIAIEARENPAGGNAAFSTMVWSAVGLEPEDLLDKAEENVERTWDRKTERAVGQNRLTYGRLVLDERPIGGFVPEFEALLEQALRQAWPRPFEDAVPLATYARRREIVLTHLPDAPLPDLAHADFDLFLTSLCSGRRSFSELTAMPLSVHIREQLSSDAIALLDSVAPESIRLPSGRTVAVHYEADKPPWVSAFLQNFFGTATTPRIGRFQLPVVVHLLAPNSRPVQVTDSLERFWRETYPQLRPEYARRYPRHSWPEDPRNAEPPRPRPR